MKKQQGLVPYFYSIVIQRESETQMKQKGTKAWVLKATEINNLHAQPPANEEKIMALRFPQEKVAKDFRHLFILFFCLF